MLALICIRESGLWETFWDWLDRRDIRWFEARLNGGDLNRLRGNLPPTPQPAHATERVDVDECLDNIDVT